MIVGLAELWTFSFLRIGSVSVYFVATTRQTD